MARPYTFNPPEEELINHYLNNKIAGNDDLVESEINEINICQHEPHNLPGQAKIRSSNTWYFVSRAEKFGRCNRTKRTTRTGHWKVTGKSCLVKDSGGVPIGFKKFLVFQESKASSSSSSSRNLPHRSTWVIHEFHSLLQHRNKDVFVLCKLMKKGGSGGSVASTDPFLSDPHEQITAGGDVIMPMSSMVHNHYNDAEELFPEFHHNPNWFSVDLLLQSHFHPLQPQSFAHPIPTWNGGVPIGEADSGMNPNYQETGELACGSHVYGPNTEVSGGVGGYGSSGQTRFQTGSKAGTLGFVDPRDLDILTRGDISFDTPPTLP
ncbi:PREDICTED: NAC domain-containing protein 1 isoform X2 [Tarenaya hassleriana]|uniref:NAC domain-containing protein 1 isoform X2 n=1 Tax=Tarenaya hassleriana TaxID=28532 RepID=UPI00053C1F22|nr:PREDICTED: NAC domain-containing protein 1 isoform X2 [Tarenaya hassleriana]